MNDLDRVFYSSPIGILELVSSEKALLSASFVEQKQEVEKHKIPHSILTFAIKQLEEYFNGKRIAFDLPITPEGTLFQKKVWANLSSISYGNTISYLQLARMTGDEKSVRTVGTANGKNKLSIIVPCHRVIGSNGKLVGYSGKLWRKHWLLEHEAKVSGRVIDFK